MTDKCNCTADTHGHEPGKCQNMAMEGNTRCEACDEYLADENIGEMSAPD